MPTPSEFVAQWQGSTRTERAAAQEHFIDAAVLAAYGWPEDLSDDQVLAHLLQLNLARSAAAVSTAGGAA